MTTVTFRPTLGKYASSNVPRVALCERPGRLNEQHLARVLDAREWRKPFTGHEVKPRTSDIAYAHSCLVAALSGGSASLVLIGVGMVAFGIGAGTFVSLIGLAGIALALWGAR